MEIEKGQRWYLKLPGAVAVVERTIHEVTEKTVVLREDHPSGQISRGRYAKADIDFIETF